MAYFLRSRPDSRSWTLIEATKVQAREITWAGYTLEPMTGVKAHDWVRSGRLHETPLYVDWDGRIRYAKGEGA